MRSPSLYASIAIALLTGCAGSPNLPTIKGAETVAILVTANGQTQAALKIRNEALETGATAGAGSGLVAGGLWGLVCGPFAVLCVPLGAAAGAIGGTAAGAVVGLTGALPDDKAAKLRERLSRVQAAHPIADELQRNVNTRALKYWTVSTDLTFTVITIEVQDLELMSTRDEKIRCAIRVTVSVKSPGSGSAGVPVKKQYEYLDAYSPLSVWLDENSDFVDTSFSSASQQIAAQIVSDLTSH